MLPLVTHRDYSYPFPEKHRFAMDKFRRLHETLQNSGIATRENTFTPGLARRGLIQLAHHPDYVSRFAENRLDPRALRRLGLPWSPGLVRRSFISPHGTLLTAHLALRHGIACHLAGGTHHAHYDYPAGFCIFNDLAIAAHSLLQSGHVQRLLIFDCDVHQGDGTARILAAETRAFTCSIHCEKNYPARKAHSDLDVPLPPGTGDDTYLDTIDRTLHPLLDQHKPDLVLYDAGVDVTADDELGYFTLTWEGLRLRDRMVLQHCRRRNIPVATVIGGGYGRDRAALARRHAICVEEAFHRLHSRNR